MQSYRDYTEEKLIDTICLLSEEMASIRFQLDAATAGEREGEGSEWFRKAMFALRMKGAQHQALQLELGRRRRVAQVSLEAHFVRTAKILLAPETFQKIMEEAKVNVKLYQA